MVVISLLEDLRYGARVLIKNPGFAAVAVIAIALGVGANTAIFSVVNAVLLRPLPFDGADRLLGVSATYPESKSQGLGFSTFPNFADWRDQGQSFEQMAAFRNRPLALTGVEEPERIGGARVSSDFFPLLGIQPIMGRVFLPEEDQPGSGRTVVLGHALWQRRFGADPNLIGRAITLDGQSHTVIGILPAGFEFPLLSKETELWTSVSLDGMTLKERGAQMYGVIARLKAGVSLEQAQAEISTIASRLEQQYPDKNTGSGARLIRMQELLVSSIRPALLVLFAAVGFVLLIACANVANLLLARASSRKKEIAIRTALGANRGRIIRQLLTESMMLAVMGAAVGLLLALWGMDLLIALGPDNIPRLDEINIDSSTLAFTVGVTLLTGLVFGLAPALHASKLDLNESLKEGVKGAGGASGHGRFRNLLVVAQVTLALVLLVGAGLLIKSFYRLQNVDPGFNPENVLTLRVALPAARYPEAHHVTAFFDQALTKIGALPGVVGAGTISFSPLSGATFYLDFDIEGRPPAGPGKSNEAQYRSISANYFRVMEIPLKRGRHFTEVDRRDAPGVAIINETMARRFWPDEDPIGKRISLQKSMGEDEPPWREIVGVAGDVKHFGLDADVRPEMYAPDAQQPLGANTIVIRTSNDPTAMIAAVRSEILSVDKDQPVSNVQTLEYYVTRSTARQRFSMILLFTFAAVALVLAAVGVYGVTSYSVTQRTHEIGIRMALGAQQKDVLRLVLGQGLKLTAIGVGIGLAAAFALTRAMTSLLFEVSANDSMTFIIAPVVLAGVALAACFVPARRATRVDPGVALRYE
jgi:putative ABC transport system permease protein